MNSSRLTSFAHPVAGRRAAGVQWFEQGRMGFPLVARHVEMMFLYWFLSFFDNCSRLTFFAHPAPLGILRVAGKRWFTNAFLTVSNGLYGSDRQIDVLTFLPTPGIIDFT